MDLDNMKDIIKIDRDNMLGLLVSFPKQCRDALAIGKKIRVKDRYKKDYSDIVFTGLGGSAVGGDIIKGYAESEADTPIFVNRNYTLPKFVDKDSLVFAVSYSGNTEETLSAYAEAKKRRANVIVITSGGKLEELALKNGDMLIVIPKGYPPRCALGYIFIPSLIMLSKLGFVKDKSDEIRKVADLLDGMQKKKLSPGIKGGANISKEIAKKIHNKFPVIYAAERMEGIATRWRGEFAENSKTLSSAHLFPEMNHNEIVGWMNPGALLKDFIAIVLRDKDDLAKVKKRMDITCAILKKEGFHVLEVENRVETLLGRMLSLIYIGDFASFYLAVLNRVEPTPVARITYLKKQLAR
ncbi:MAG: bifunctional phosphoglucose/phosphomannose isomerase [Omnitrophica bacterium RBG_13_46_9]|nr:MAG: bifunctional phosphoglucose/phosphomannose isomerase [Omnitrophica bacterium RBG_13_46_9]